MIKYTNNIYKGYESQPTVIPIKSDFEKSAYAMADPVKEFIETLKPSGDVKYDWVNALGAGETYGSNSRGDYFPRQELIDHHHTFVDNPAHVYIQHNNKNPDIRLGSVLFSYFNPDTDRVEVIQSLEKPRIDKYASDWVRSDLHLDRDYNTSMGCFCQGTKIKTSDGVKNIEDITKEDYVLTHLGNYKKVTNLFSRHFTEGLYKIKIQSKGIPVNVTYEHPFYTIPKEQLIYNNLVNFVKKASTVEPQWIKTQDLKEGDYLGYAFNTDTVYENLPSKEIARLLGYYLSDGYLSKAKNGLPDGLSFTFNSTEPQYIEEVSNLLNTLSNNKVVIRDDHSNSKAKRVEFYDVKFVKDFVKYFNSNKTLKPEVLLWPKELQLELLGAFINGDGFIYNRSSYIEIKNYEMADQLCQIACRNGLMWSINKIVHKANENSVCKTGTISIGWQIQFGKTASNILSKVTDKAVEYNGQAGDRQFYHGNCLFSKITSIEFNPEWSGQIYNFEVEDDESYVANNIAVHNCRVAYDQCSVCNQKNKTVAEYCDHLKNHMNKWAEGTHVHAINVDPNFFDNSIVRLGADRTARRLSKVASVDIISPLDTIWTDEDLASTKRKFYMGFTPSKKPYINESNIKQASKVPEFHKQDLDYLCQYDLPVLLGTLKVASIDLLPHEYQYLVLNKMGEIDLANDYWDSGIRFRIPDDISNKDVNLNVSEDLYKDLIDVIPLRSNSEPFAIYRALAGNFSRESRPIKIASDILLDTIGESYSNYISNQEKIAADWWTILTSFFMNLPVLLTNRQNARKVSDVRDLETTAIKDRVAKVPLLPRVYNPIFRNEFLIKNAEEKFLNKIKNTGKSIIKNTKRIGSVLPLATGAAATAFLAGQDAKKEIEGDETVGTGLPAMARKHPILTTLGATTGVYALKSLPKEIFTSAKAETKNIGQKIKNLFTKKANLEYNQVDNFTIDYINFLSKQSNEFILDAITKMSDDLKNKIINI